MLDFTRPLGDTVKKARTEQGFTQASIAERVDIDSRTIINIERYKGNPTLEILYPLVRALNIDPWDIFYPEMKHDESALRQINLFLRNCSEEELKVLLPICQTVIETLRSKDAQPIE